MDWIRKHEYGLIDVQVLPSYVSDLAIDALVSVIHVTPNEGDVLVFKRLECLIHTILPKTNRPKRRSWQERSSGWLIGFGISSSRQSELIFPHGNRIYQT
jgi:hypothetical protein